MDDAIEKIVGGTGDDADISQSDHRWSASGCYSSMHQPKNNETGDWDDDPERNGNIEGYSEILVECQIDARKKTVYVIRDNVGDDVAFHQPIAECEDDEDDGSDDEKMTTHKTKHRAGARCGGIIVLE